MRPLPFLTNGCLEVVERLATKDPGGHHRLYRAVCKYAPQDTLRNVNAPISSFSTTRKSCLQWCPVHSRNRKLGAATINDIQKLTCNGDSARRIAEELGVGRTTVYRHSAARNGQVKSSGISEEQILLYLFLKGLGLNAKIGARIDIEVSPKIAVQLDPSYTHSDSFDRDVQQSKELQEAGYRVIRLREEPLCQVPGFYNISYFGSNNGRVPEVYCKYLSESVYEYLYSQKKKAPNIPTTRKLNTYRKYKPTIIEAINQKKEEFRKLIKDGRSPSWIRNNRKDLYHFLGRRVGYEYKAICAFCGVIEETTTVYRAI